MRLKNKSLQLLYSIIRIESIEVLKRHIYDHTLYELKEMAQL